MKKVKRQVNNKYSKISVAMRKLLLAQVILHKKSIKQVQMIGDIFKCVILCRYPQVCQEHKVNYSTVKTMVRLYRTGNLKIRMSLLQDAVEHRQTPPRSQEDEMTSGWRIIPRYSNDNSEVSFKSSTELELDGDLRSLLCTKQAQQGSIFP